MKGKIKKHIVVLFLVLCLIVGYNYTTNRVYASQRYIVKPGDSLYKISLLFNTSIQAIKEANNLVSDLIYVDQVLIIPGQNDDSKSYFTYVVKPGDSLYKLALKFETSISKIKEINNLSSNMIYIGQRLSIPSANYLQVYEGRVYINNKTRGTKLTGFTPRVTIENEIEPIQINTLPNYKNNEIIVRYKPLVSPQSQDDFAKKEELIHINTLETDKGRIVNYRVPEGKNINDLIKKYNELPEVAWAEPNYLYYPLSIPNDEFYKRYQWGHVASNLEAAWDLSTGDSSITVAVIDTGIIPNHPDLKDNLLPGVDFAGGEKIYPIDEYNFTDKNPVDETNMNQGGSHGTHVAGIIGAVTNNKQGVAGVTWNVNLIPIRVMGAKGGSSWDIAEGIYYALDRGADVINLSLGSSHKSFLQHEAIKKAVKQGVCVVAAAGNDHASVYYPAAFPETIAVGAIGVNYRIANYSNFGPEIDVVAPGGGYGDYIFSTWGYNNQGDTKTGYTWMAGTSMATPYVSGIVALLKAYGISSPEEIKSRLQRTARDLGEKGKDNYYGYGLVDAYAALLGYKLPRSYVMTAYREGDKLYATSEVVKAESGEKLRIEERKEGSELIFGWSDVNQNGLIDGGDYYGELNINDISDKKNLEINLHYLSDSYEQIKYSVVML